METKPERIERIKKQFEDIVKLTPIQKKLRYINEQKNFFINLKPFEKEEDIPSLPKVDKKEWNHYFVPILVEKGALPKNKLIDGKTYLGNCRNGYKGKWNQGENVFEIDCFTFGIPVVEKINHFEDDDGYDLFVPIKEMDG